MDGLSACEYQSSSPNYRQIQIMSTLPLKALSRLWGRFNELQIPYYLRVPGFKLYSWIFGVKCVFLFRHSQLFSNIVQSFRNRRTGSTQLPEPCSLLLSHPETGYAPVGS